MASNKTLFITFLIALLGLCLAAMGIYSCLALHEPLEGLFLIIVAIGVLVALRIVYRGQRRLDELELQLLEEGNRAMLETLRQDKKS